MALLRFDLPPRRLAGIYSRVVRRELGFLVPFLPRSVIEVGRASGLFARSLAVALGQSFAAGEFVRPEFAQALRDRLRNFPREYVSSPNLFPLVEAIDHAALLAEIVAGTRSDSQLQNLQIYPDAVSDAVQADYLALSREGDLVDWSPDGSLGPLWRGEQPGWWQQWPIAPDSWVTPMNQLGQPIWTSQRLPPANLSYLLNFGLDQIESNPDLIGPWTRSVSTLVAAASTQKTDIRELVECCRIKP